MWLQSGRVWTPSSGSGAQNAPTPAESLCPAQEAPRNKAEFGYQLSVDSPPLATSRSRRRTGRHSGNVYASTPRRLDASTQGTNITGVHFVVSFGSVSDLDFLAAKPTYYGWIGDWI